MSVERRAGLHVNVLRTGPDLTALMLHCTLARLETLLPLARALPGDAVLMDLLGHGASQDWDAGLGDYQTANASAAADLCEGPLHVIGHSFGATVALRMALDFPGTVSRLTLIEPVYFALATDPAAQADHVARFAPIHAAYDAGDAVTAARLFQADWGGGGWDRIPERTRDAIVQRMPLVMAGVPSIQDDVHGVAARLGQIHVPVTLIRGEGALPIIPAIQAAICAALPQARDHVVPGAGHMVALTHVPQVAAIIASDAR
ncbi:Pimeloyl-ACP methyl ester carboxylesterase [Loktanella fryxellensis]|uniref:Pimeloyl-ACP methyl ester carboxylesterase n=1 Tax=Loktanella fryxellensis TaxID=245187 RepID=A0A1H8DAJ0_9RHOB|nr:alpha/beta fold hydrolase [Loktanella fryxellensis]SEN04381.1 Pimeloyl-ACP methyl ester carboxylesterase [Loktanella fryxellensis]